MVNVINCIKDMGHHLNSQEFKKPGSVVLFRYTAIYKLCIE